MCVSPVHDRDVIVLNMLEEKMVSILCVLLRGLKRLQNRQESMKAVVGVGACRSSCYMLVLQVQCHGRRRENTF